MSKLVNLVGSGIGLACEGSESHQSTSASKTRRSATRDANNPGKTGNDFQSRPRGELEYHNQSDYQNCLEDCRSDPPEDRQPITAVQRAAPEWTKGDEDPQDSVNQWIGLPPPYYGQGYEESVNQARRVLPPTQHHSSKSNNLLRGRLPSPIIIPQRRPENKEHCFIRDYAPALMDCSIDQTTFLHFLDALTRLVR
jgi:hypothetical protein